MLFVYIYVFVSICAAYCVCVCECSNKATILDRRLYCILASFGKNEIEVLQM